MDGVFAARFGDRGIRGGRAAVPHVRRARCASGRVRAERAVRVGGPAAVSRLGTGGADAVAVVPVRVDRRGCAAAAAVYRGKEEARMRRAAYTRRTPTLPCTRSGRIPPSAACPSLRATDTRLPVGIRRLVVALQ